MKTATSLRQQRKRQTREHLQAAALKLFTARGFGQTSVDDVAAEAGVSRTTFFRYFPTKEAVVFANPEEMAFTFQRLLAERPAHENPLAAFEHALIALATAVENDPALVKESITRQELLENNPDLKARRADYTMEQKGRVARILAARDGLSEPGPEHRLAAAIGFEVAEDVSAEWVRAKGKIPASEVLRLRFDAVRALTS